MSTFVIVHPEGNLNNNPCLSGMVEILCDRGHRARILSPRRGEIAVRPPCAGAEVRLFESANTNGAFLLDGASDAEMQDLDAAMRQRTGEADLVIGVDRGMIDASCIARLQQVPLACLSFEIFFEDEAGASFKEEERIACRNIALAICQDDVRAAHLARENRVPLERIRRVPVSGRGYKAGNKTSYWHERFSIPAGEHVALYMGSIAEWSLGPYILDSASRWTSGWHLVMHHRYVADSFVTDLMTRYAAHPRIHFSDVPFDTTSDMTPALLGADLGLALYQPQPGALHEGHNLEAIGMASGKIAVYLQHGLPVAINEIGEMSSHVRARRLGTVIDVSHPWTPLMPEFDPGAIRRFFETTLDLERTFAPVVAELEALCTTTIDCPSRLLRTSNS
jgi:O-antigen biosynthesis protein